MTNPMDIQERIEQSIARQERVVFKNLLNEHDVLFGGFAMQWMDEVAYLSAAKFLGKDVLTVSAGPIRFLKPIPFRSFIATEAKVCDVGKVKLKVQVDIWMCDKQTGTKTKAMESEFVFVAIDQNLKPTRLRME